VVHELAVIGCNLPGDYCNTLDSVPQEIEDVVTSDLAGHFVFLGGVHKGGFTYMCS
jgi:hypothetical protein